MACRTIFNATFCCGNMLQQFEVDSNCCNIVARTLLELVRVTPSPSTFNATSYQNAPRERRNKARSLNVTVAYLKNYFRNRRTADAKLTFSRTYCCSHYRVLPLYMDANAPNQIIKTFFVYAKISRESRCILSPSNPAPRPNNSHSTSQNILFFKTVHQKKNLKEFYFLPLI